MAKTYRWKGESKARHTRPQGEKYRSNAPGQKDPRQKLKKALTPEQKQKKWRKTPITPGSTITNYDVKRGGKAAARLEYGGRLRAEKQDVKQAETYRGDIGDYYQEYLRHLAANAAQVRQSGDVAAGQIGTLQQGVTGISGNNQVAQQGAANADAAGRGATAGNLAPLANQATAVRQSLVAGLGAQQAGVNKASSDYAGALSERVGPGQKLQAVMSALGQERKARQRVTDTRSEIGAYRQKYKQDVKGREAENVTAQGIAAGKTAQEMAELNERTRASKADERQAARDARQDKKDAEANRRIDQNRIDAENKRAQAQIRASDGKVVTSGAFQGLTSGQIKALTPAQQRARIRAYDKAHGSGGGGGGGGGGGSTRVTMPPVQKTKARTQLTSLLSDARLAKAGKKFEKGDPTYKKGKTGRATAAKRLLSRGDLIDPSLVSAVLDAVYDGHLSHGTAVKLQQIGLSAREVASLIGTKTRKQWQQAFIDANTKAAAGHGLPPEVGHQ